MITDAHVIDAVRSAAWQEETLPDGTTRRRMTPEGIYGRKKMTALIRRTAIADASWGAIDRATTFLGLVGVTRAKAIRTTIPGKVGNRAGDLLDRDFTAPRPDHTWVMDGSAEGLVVTLGCMTFYCRAGRMTTMPKIYSEEFKRDAVGLVNSGMTQRQVCTDLGISRSSLQNWVNQDRLHSRGLTAPVDASERKENAAAMKRIRELEMENEVLRRAATYLSQAHITPPK